MGVSKALFDIFSLSVQKKRTGQTGKRAKGEASYALWALVRFALEISARQDAMSRREIFASPPEFALAVDLEDLQAVRRGTVPQVPCDCSGFAAQSRFACVRAWSNGNTLIRPTAGGGSDTEKASVPVNAIFFVVILAKAVSVCHPRTAALRQYGTARERESGVLCLPRCFRSGGFAAAYNEKGLFPGRVIF